MKSAILITYDDEDSIKEAKALCDSANYKVSHLIKEKFLKRAKYGITEEKIDQLQDISSQIKPDVVIFDEILRPSQNYNLASKLHLNVLDRETLILEIFESRASSAESRLQIKLAQLRYEMSRAKEKVRLAKKGEQPGFLGIGKFEVETYYRDIKHRMIGVKSKLVKTGKQRKLHRDSRKKMGFKTISLAGYTSAGKTTLFNFFTGQTHDQSPELFTTLSTTTRKIRLDNTLVLLSDTVGFISKLPAYMIDAFKSTLEELTYTDVVLVVVDIHDPILEMQKKFQSCIKTLNEIGVESDNIIFVLNKVDLINESELPEKVNYLGLKDSKKWVPFSALAGQNVRKLEQLILKLLREKPVQTIKKEKKFKFSEIYEN